jgi:hypothetical protein
MVVLPLPVYGSKEVICEPWGSAVVHGACSKLRLQTRERASHRYTV